MPRSLPATRAGSSASSWPVTTPPVWSRTLYVKVSGTGSPSASVDRGRVRAGQPAQVVFVRTAFERGLERDLPGLDQAGQRLVHRDHPVLPARLHQRVDLVDLALTDE